MGIIILLKHLRLKHNMTDQEKGGYQEPVADSFIQV